MEEFEKKIKIFVLDLQKKELKELSQICQHPNKNEQEFKELYNIYWNEYRKDSKEDLSNRKDLLLDEMYEIVEAKRLKHTPSRLAWLKEGELKPLLMDRTDIHVREKQKEINEKEINTLEKEIKKYREQERVELIENFDNVIKLHVYSALLDEKNGRKEYIEPKEVKYNIFNFNGKKKDFAILINDVYNKIKEYDKKELTKDKILLRKLYNKYCENNISKPKDLARLMLKDFNGREINDYKEHKKGFEHGLKNLMKMMTNRCDNWYLLKGAY